jgi:hypothetical protein
LVLGSFRWVFMDAYATVEEVIGDVYCCVFRAPLHAAQLTPTLSKIS